MLRKNLCRISPLLVILMACAAPGAAPAAVPSEERLTIASDAVAILVIDDFELVPQDSASAIDEVRTLPEGEEGYCVYTPAGQVDMARKGVATGQSTGIITGISHGDLVYDRLVELLDISYPDPSRQAGTGLGQFGVDWIRRINVWQEKVVLVAVDTVGYTTSLVIAHTDEAITRLHRDQMIERFVLNMSFAILPCDTSLSSAQYRSWVEGNSDYQHLEEYLNALDVSSGEERQDLLYGPEFGRARLELAYLDPDFYAAITSPTLQDPMFLKLNEYQDDTSRGSIISIASSGNWGMGSPFAPAIWESVVSASASENGNPSQLASESNDGEVMVDGTYTYDGTPYTATSFAAPMLSSLAADYLLRDGNVQCSGNSGPAIPPLGYAPVNGPWWHLEVVTATQEYCSCFLAGQGPC